MKLIDLVNSVVISNNLTLLFLLGSQTVTLKVLLFWIFFLSSDSSICSAMAFLPLENRDHVVSVTVDFPSNSQWDALFHPIAYDYSCAYCDSLCDHFKEDIFKLSASAGAG